MGAEHRLVPLDAIGRALALERRLHQDSRMVACRSPVKVVELYARAGAQDDND